MIPGKFPSLGFDIGNFAKCKNCQEPIRRRNGNAVYCSSECKNKKNQVLKKSRRYGYHNVGRTRKDGKNPL